MNEIVVRYVCPESISEQELQRHLECLSPEEIEKYHRFRQDKHKHLYLAAHWLLRRTLAACLQVDAKAIRYGYEKFGKPFLVADERSTVQFSLTHTHGLVACAVGNRLVGIDAESTDRRVNQELANRVLTANEFADYTQIERSLGEASAKRRFLEYWTLKEAYLKALGRGLTVPMHQVELQFRDEKVHLFKSVIDSMGWRFHLLPVQANYILALAVQVLDDSEPEIDLRLMQLGLG